MRRELSCDSFVSFTGGFEIRGTLLNQRRLESTAMGSGTACIDMRCEGLGSEPSRWSCCGLEGFTEPTGDRTGPVPNGFEPQAFVECPGWTTFGLAQPDAVGDPNLGHFRAPKGLFCLANAGAPMV